MATFACPQCNGKGVMQAVPMSPGGNSPTTPSSPMMPAGQVPMMSVSCTGCAGSGKYNTFYPQ